MKSENVSMSEPAQALELIKVARDLIDEYLCKVVNGKEEKTDRVILNEVVEMILYAAIDHLKED